jgi:hypothetical protein
MTPALIGESEQQAAEDMILKSQLATTVGLCLALFGPALLFMATQDLIACMIAHTITDAVGFISAQRVARAS